MESGREIQTPAQGPMPLHRMSPESVLFITLDSCRYDSFVAAAAPGLKAVGPLHRAQAPGYFTYASHSAMFVGFTPGATTDPVPLLNPKHAKLFKMRAGGWSAGAAHGYELEGANIVEGFAGAGFLTFGTAAVGWFDPASPTGRHLSSPFQEFLYAPGPGGAEGQAGWLASRLDAAGDRDVFAFLNAGETHVPYWHQGADWPADDNTCTPFQQVDRRAECEARQRACVEHLDGVLRPLVERFLGSTILLCADHGDAWGEDGVWEHGVAHPSVLTVPMMMRLRGAPVGA